MGAVNENGDVVLLELSSRADAGEHEELGRLKNTLRDDDFVLGVQGKLLASREVDHDDTSADLGGWVDDELFGLGQREDGDVGFAV